MSDSMNIGMVFGVLAVELCSRYGWCWGISFVGMVVERNQNQSSL